MSATCPASAVDAPEQSAPRGTGAGQHTQAKGDDMSASSEINSGVALEWRPAIDALIDVGFSRKEAYWYMAMCPPSRKMKLSSQGNVWMINQEGLESARTWKAHHPSQPRIAEKITKNRLIKVWAVAKEVREFQAAHPNVSNSALSRAAGLHRDFVGELLRAKRGKRAREISLRKLKNTMRGWQPDAVPQPELRHIEEEPCAYFTVELYPSKCGFWYRLKMAWKLLCWRKQ